MEDQEIANVVIQIADKLGIAASEIAKIFIEAQPKIAIVNISLLLLTIVITGVVFKKSWVYFYNKGKEDSKSTSYIDENVVAPAALIAIVTLFICLITSLAMADSLYKLVVPEYMGLKDLLITFSRLI